MGLAVNKEKFNSKILGFILVQTGHFQQSDYELVEIRSGWSNCFSRISNQTYKKFQKIIQKTRARKNKNIRLANFVLFSQSVSIDEYDE